MRPVTLERHVAPYAEGSCLIAFGTTRVLCTASIEDGVPGWRRGQGRRVADRRVRDASAGDADADAARAIADRRADAGDSAADRAERSRDARRLSVRRIHAQDRLRRAAGGRRHADGGDHRRGGGGRRCLRLDGDERTVVGNARAPSRRGGQRRADRGRPASRSRLRGRRCRGGRHECRDEQRRAVSSRCREPASTARSPVRSSTGCSTWPIAGIKTLDAAQARALGA